MQDPQHTGPDWSMIFVTSDELGTAMAHPNFSGFVPLRQKTYDIDGYLVTFGLPAMKRGAQALNERGQHYEAATRGEQA